MGKRASIGVQRRRSTGHQEHDRCTCWITTGAHIAEHTGKGLAGINRVQKKPLITGHQPYRIDHCVGDNAVAGAALVARDEHVVEIQPLACTQQIKSAIRHRQSAVAASLRARQNGEGSKLARSSAERLKSGEQSRVRTVAAIGRDDDRVIEAVGVQLGVQFQRAPHVTQGAD